MKNQFLFVILFNTVLTINLFSQTTFSSIGVGQAPSSSNKVNIYSGWGDFIQFRRSQNAGFFGLHNPSDASALILYYKTPAGATNFGYLSVYENGKIAMGEVNTPGNYRLYVKDGILAEKVKVAVSSTSHWADYVFKPGYKLMDLNEVDKYIKENQHLPGIPSAEEVVEGGMDVVNMTSLLLSKIEELTLYSIEQEKKIRELEERINALERRVNNEK